MMHVFLRNKKFLSSLILFSLVISFLPIFTQKAEAVVQNAASAAQAAATIGEAGMINSASCLDRGVLKVGSGQICDMGVRFNTLNILKSTLGVGPGVAAKENIWDSIAYFMGRILVRQISQSIVDWINSGFNGNPSFVQDPEKFMTDTADRTIGEFIFASDLKALCSPFEINVRLNLGLGYSPFKDKINCTLSGVLKNTDGAISQAYTDFMNGDFINGGGWDSWLQITTQPQNNQVGALMIAQAELDAKIAEKQLAKKDELNWSGGLLSMKKCTRTTTDANGKVIETKNFQGDSYYQPFAPGAKVGTTQTTQTTVQTSTNPDIPEELGGPITGSGTNTKDVCNIVTPGTWITGTGQKVLGMDLDRLGAADEINEIVGALANFVISEVMKKGMAMIKKEDLSPDNPSWQEGISTLQNQQSNDVNATEDDSAYEPSYDSYTGLGNATTDDPLVNSTKESLQDRLTADQGSEQDYFNAYNSVYTLASSTETALRSVINSCTAKLNRTNPPPTANVRTTTQGFITTASSSINLMLNIKASTTPQIISAQSNLTGLQAISDQVDGAYEMDVLDQQDTDLTNLEQVLHTPDQIVDAENYASTTINQINIKKNWATVTVNQCNSNN